MSLIRVYSHRVAHIAPLALRVKQYPSGGRSMTLHPVQLPFRIVVRLPPDEYRARKPGK